MPTIQSTVDDIIEVTHADFAKSQVLDLVMKLAKEIGTKVLERYRGIRTHPVAVTDPNLRPSDEARVMSHTKLILKRLMECGPQTNLQLSRISLRVTARIHDLRRTLKDTKWTVESRHISGSLWEYALVRVGS